jgi:hypothetical protein
MMTLSCSDFVTGIPFRYRFNFGRHSGAAARERGNPFRCTMDPGPAPDGASRNDEGYSRSQDDRAPAQNMPTPWADRNHASDTQSGAMPHLAHVFLQRKDGDAGMHVANRRHWCGAAACRRRVPSAMNLPVSHAHEAEIAEAEKRQMRKGVKSDDYVRDAGLRTAVGPAT